MKTIRFELGNFKDVHFLQCVEIVEKDRDSIVFKANAYPSYILTSKDCVNYKKEHLNLCEVQLPDEIRDRKHEVFPYIFKWVYPKSDCCSAGELTCEITVPQYMYVAHMMHKNHIDPYKK